MKRIILIVGLSMLAAPFWCNATAQAQRQNYIPYKIAMEHAFEFYSDTFWDPVATAKGGTYGLDNIDAFDPYSNVWGLGAQDECCYLKALYGLFPDDGLDYSVKLPTLFTIGSVYCRPLDAETKAFLYPFLKGHATAFQLRALYHPPIMDLQEATPSS